MVKRRKKEEAEINLTINNSPHQNSPQKIVVYEMKDTTIAEILEQKEIELTLEEVKGKLIDKLAYSFIDSNGREISGLTKWGLISCCQNLKEGGFSPIFSEPKIELLNQEYALLKIEAKNPVSGQTAVGICQFKIGQRFSERIAETIAKRRALENLLPISIQQAYIEYLKKKKPDKVVKIRQEDYKSVKEIQKESGNVVDDKTKAMRMLFALIHEKGLDVEKWKEWIKKQIGVEHFNEISIEKMRELYKTYKKLNQYEIEEIKQIIEKQQEGGDKNE
jgi:uncharacterized short protein YbdD (DUF466 family)